MAENIFRSLGKESDIFKNERVLMPEYIPDMPLHREREIREIAESLRNASRGERPENLIITGPPGTGKTCCVKHVLNELTDYSKIVLPIYINCWEFSTRHAILTQIAFAIGEFVPRRGIATDEITLNIVELLKKEKRIPIIVLDEIDKLEDEVEDIRILYDLSRANEIFSINVGLIGISNSINFLATLDSRIRSSLAQRTMRFGRYTPIELRDIVNERAQLGLLSGVADEDVIGLCAAIGMKNEGDARIAIQTLWKAGREAEKRNSDKIRIEDVKVAADMATHGSKISEIKFDEVENQIIRILKEKGEMSTNELYGMMKNKPRTVRKYLLLLIKRGIIRSRRSTGKDVSSKDGHVRLVALKNSKK